MVTLSIIIPTFNRKTELELCLKSLAPENQHYSTQNYEIIVSNDGSDLDLALPESIKPLIKFIDGPKLGPAANRNNGAKHASGELLVFLDDDCIPQPSLLNAYHNAAVNSPDIQVFEGKISSLEERTSLEQVAPINQTGGFLWSCNFAIRRQYFAEIKGFNALFLYPAMEDVELQHRIKQQKAEIKFVPEAEVIHPWRKRPGWSYQQKHFESTLLFLQLHPEQRKIINSRYYFRFAIVGLLRDTLPNLTKFKGRGLTSALSEHLAFLWAGLKLLWKS